MLLDMNYRKRLDNKKLWICLVHVEFCLQVRPVNYWASKYQDSDVNMSLRICLARGTGYRHSPVSVTVVSTVQRRSSQQPPHTPRIPKFFFSWYRSCLCVFRHRLQPRELREIVVIVLLKPSNRCTAAVLLTTLFDCCTPACDAANYCTCAIPIFDPRLDILAAFLNCFFFCGASIYHTCVSVCATESCVVLTAVSLSVARDNDTLH